MGVFQRIRLSIMKITPQTDAAVPHMSGVTPDLQEPESGAQDSNFKEQNPEVIYTRLFATYMPGLLVDSV